MARSRIAKGLPALAEALPGFAGFAPDQPRSDQIRRHLVTLARSMRRRQPVPFYSMPDVARFFGVAVTTVAHLYRTLEAEGLLQRRRGAMTLVCGQQSRPRAQLRGVVAIPVWAPGFLRFFERRLFHRELDEQLRRHRFVGDQLFFRQGEELQPEFVDRVLDHQPDAVIWLLPALGDMETIRSIREAGVPVIVIADQPALVTEAYQISRRRAFAQGLTAWRESGIRTVVIPGSETEAAGRSGVVHEIATVLGMRLVYTNPPAGQGHDDLASLARDVHTGVLFEDDMWFEWLCRNQRGDVLALMRRARTMVTTTLGILPHELTGLYLDAVRLPWADIAARVALDLGADSARLTRPSVRFEAVWQPRIPARDLSAHYFAE